MSGRAVTILLRRDVVDGGAYSVTGTVTEKTIPGSYRLWLHDQQSGRCIRETWSDALGAYAFSYLDTKPKYLVAFDHTSPVQTAAVQDNVIPS